MPRNCRSTRLPDGTPMIVCGPPRRGPRRCAIGPCRRPAWWLCDGPGRRRGQTCDNPICDAHRTRWAVDVDLCPWHREPADPQAPQQLALPSGGDGP